MAENLSMDDPVTRHMRREFVQLNVTRSAGQALDDLLARQPEGRILYLYVTDDDGKLQGVVPTRRLLLSPRATPLADIMVRQVVTIPAEATVLDACEFFTMYRLLAFPVVDAERRIIGLVDVDLYTEEMRDLEKRQDSDELFQLIGVHLTEAQQHDPLLAFRQRFPWLLANMAGGLAAAFLAGLFEAQLQRALALAMFIPVVLALAESVSIQSVSLALQTMHGRRPTWASLWPKLGRELLTGAFLGGASGVTVGLVALLWKGETRVAATVLGGIAAGMMCAALFGLAMPNLLRMLRRDPQVAAGPIALALSDIATLLLYFNLARWLIG